MVDNRQGIIRYVMWEHRKYASKKKSSKFTTISKIYLLQNGRIDKQKCADCLFFYLLTKSIFWKYFTSILNSR